MMDDGPIKTKVYVWIRRPKNKIDIWFVSEGLVNVDDNEVAVLVSEDYLPELLQVEVGGKDDRKEGEEDLHQGKQKGHKTLGDAPKSDGPQKRKKSPNKRSRKSHSRRH